MLTVAGELYRSALAEDPDYAPAWAKLGRVYRVLAKYGSAEADADLKRAGDAFKRALEINPDLSIAHNLYTNFEVESLGRAKEAMIRLLGRAGSSSDPEIFTGLVFACRYCGLLDASLAADRHARRLDPSVRTSVMYTHFMRGDWERAIASDTDTLRWVTNWTLPLVGRQDEAIAAYREIETRALPGRIRELMRASRFALEGKSDEAIQVIERFWAKDFDPEGLYFTARVLAKLQESGTATAMLNRMLDGGFFCPPVLLHDPWLDPIRGTSAFNEILHRAETKSRDAENEFKRLGGDKILV
jgi:tetratricopeptide (TPR) repeat protein